MSGQTISSPVRASDRERERVARIISAAAGDGLLTLDEADERQAAAYAARYRHELSPLTADLPHDGERLVQPERSPVDPAARTRLLGHAALVAAVIAAVVTTWVLTGPHRFFPAPPLAFLLFTVVLHARRVGYRPWAQSRSLR